MNIVTIFPFVFGMVLGAEVSFLFAMDKIEKIKVTNELQSCIIKILQEERGYNQVQAIINGDGAIVEKYDKIKELVERD